MRAVENSFLSDVRIGRGNVVVGALFAVFICRAVLASAIVPPWQGPDEPGHFATTYALSLPMSAEQNVQAGVLQSMVRNRFWALNEDLPPDPLPTVFYRVNESNLALALGNLSQPLYYSLGGIALMASRPADLEAAYYHLRVLGVLLAVAALGFGWAGTRLLFGTEVAAGALAIAVLHPQFLLASISVNADVLVNFWGAFVWWQAARVMTGHRRGVSIFLMLIGAVGALFTKRIGMILLGISLVIAVVSLFVNRTWPLTRREKLLIAIAAAIGGCVLLALGLLFREQVGRLWLYWSEAFTPRTSLADRLPEAFRFARMTVDYFWLIAGWLRFQPPISWLWVARILIVAGMTGALVQLVTLRTGRAPLSMAWLFVTAQLIPMLATVFWLAPSAPQARYLFPVFVPITVLLYVGLRRVVPRRYEAQWPVTFVTLLMVLDVTGFTTVHLAAYLP